MKPNNILLLSILLLLLFASCNSESNEPIQPYQLHYESIKIAAVDTTYLLDESSVYQLAADIPFIDKNHEP